MKVFRKFGGFLVALALPVALLCALWFFSLQIFTGNYGHIALEKTQREFAATEREIAMLEAREAALRQRNAGLRAEALDLDLLDERARDVLGMIGRDEVFLIAD
jgi:cell division protein FtsB